MQANLLPSDLNPAPVNHEVGGASPFRGAIVFPRGIINLLIPIDAVAPSVPV